jgi:NitT/TauT family transport system substrate-binding protein
MSHIALLRRTFARIVGAPLHTAALIATVSIVAFSAPAAVAADATPVKINFALDWRFEGPSAWFLLAKEKGYFAKEGLDVNIDVGSGSAAAIARVASGRYEMGFADISSLVEFVANNPTAPAMKGVYMVYDSTPATVFALKKSGITKPSDLTGKTLGAPTFDGGRRTFPIFAAANHIDANSVKWSSMDPAMRELMLARGQVDAITSFYFNRVALNKNGVDDKDIVAMRYGDYGVKLYGSAVLASDAFIKDHPQAVAGFVRALNAAIKEVIAHPQEGLDAIAHRDALADVALEKRRLALTIDLVESPTVMKNGLGGIDPQRFAASIEQTAKVYGLKSAPAADTLFDSAFLPPQAERMIPAK